MRCFKKIKAKLLKTTIFTSPILRHTPYESQCVQRALAQLLTQRHYRKQKFEFEFNAETEITTFSPLHEIIEDNKNTVLGVGVKGIDFFYGGQVR